MTILGYEINGWVAFGFLGQFFFSMRFIIQWIFSEKAKKSVVPVAFWYFSLLGGLILFIYALHIDDPVIILGQGLGLFIYLRNLYFVHNKKTAEVIPNPKARERLRITRLSGERYEHRPYRRF